MARELKVDLKLLKRLMSELEASLDEAYEFRDNEDTPKTMGAYQDFIVMLAKSSGYLVGIINESNLLASDLNKLIQVSGASFSDEKESPLAALFKKGSILGGNNDAN